MPTSVVCLAAVGTEVRRGIDGDSFELFGGSGGESTETVFKLVDSSSEGAEKR